ncbi:hypothetical protein G9O61_00g000470 [Vairimorpha ceranae]|nr:hypothetical protein G9O61_00g000430 [Vairimorpha ceranae]KAF5141764.1 hypothetical protein G9O61_00g000470 [Vairimorpha ceranae]
MLPKRDDHIIIIGRDWLKNAKEKKENMKPEVGIESLLEELSKERIETLPYCECKIETVEGKSIVDRQYKLL